MNYFSNNLKYLRAQKKLSQNKLAKLIGVNQTTIARWENGEMAPSLESLLDISDVLNISLFDLACQDLAKNNSDSFDELEVLFYKYKNILTEDDREYIKFIIERRKKEMEEE